LKILSEWQIKCLIISPSTLRKEHIVAFSCTSLEHSITIDYQKPLVKKLGTSSILTFFVVLKWVKTKHCFWL
jgi:hypothetical protein